MPCLPGVRIEEPAARALRRDGQARLFWDDTPVDVFLSNHAFHARAEANRRFVPFPPVARIPVLACGDLAVFKAFSARPKDALDVATMVAAGTVDLDTLRSTVDELLEDPTTRRDFFERVADDLRTHDA